MNHILLYLFGTASVRAFRDRHLVSARVLGPVVSMRLGGAADAGTFVVYLGNPGPFCALLDADPLEGLGDPVLRRLEGARLGAPAPPATDRVLTLPLPDAGAGHGIEVSLFGNAARVRYRSADVLVESLDPRESGRPVAARRARAGTPFVTCERSVFVDAARRGGDLVAAFPGLTARLLGWFRGEGETLDAEALLDFRDALRSGRAAFRLEADARPGSLAPLPDGRPAPPGEGPTTGPFPDALAACAAVAGDFTAAARAAILDTAARPLEKHLRGRIALRAKLDGELAAAEAFDVGRAEADILAAYQTKIPRGAAEIELPDIYRPGETVRIALDPSLSIREQIQRRFKRATKLERSRSTLRERLALVRRDVERIDRSLAAARESAEFGAAFRALAALQDELRVARPARRAKQAPPEGPRYRRFDLDERWFVLVGRSDRENEEVTFRLASPDDIWMHAQQVPGSHVVLKSSGGDSDNPPQSILTAAAGIAAFYSKARHSRLVPVIYTLRKYVRKFRGSRTGQVRCEREKTIFAEPRLPSAAE